MRERERDRDRERKYGAVRVRMCQLAVFIARVDLKNNENMTSAEPARTRPYSPDIGWRVVWQRLGMGLTFQKIANRLQIGVGTAHRIYARFADTGEVAPSQRGARPEARKLDDWHELYIIGLIADNPALYLYEICQKIDEVTGVKVSDSIICRVL